jgi:hypothetical protein
VMVSQVEKEEAERFWVTQAETAIYKARVAENELRMVVRQSLRTGDMSVWAWCSVFNCSRSSVYRMLGPGGAGLSRRGDGALGGGWSVPRSVVGSATRTCGPRRLASEDTG